MPHCNKYIQGLSFFEEKLKPRTEFRNDNSIIPDEVLVFKKNSNQISEIIKASLTKILKGGFEK